MLLIKNIRLKAKKLTLKYIKPFKILQYIKELIYKSKLLTLYNCLYLIFYISLLKKYIAKKGSKTLLILL
jgi:hypothetical protein